MQAFVKLTYKNVNLSLPGAWYVSCSLSSETRK